jgi:hypothetical protein
VDSLRGEDGSTPSAHDAGAIVEVIWEAETWNDNIDALLEEHNQDGTHDTTKVVDLDTAQVITNKHIELKSPEGYLLNGKIVPSVTSDDLTVAIKTLAGTDPSATDPIYVRIGDTVHTITSAVTKTWNAGINRHNAGSSELATKEIDYFVYLYYSTPNPGIYVGISRLPYGRVKTDFNGVSTNEKYMEMAWSTFCDDTDRCVNIGRFAATLSAGAGYTWTVPTFTSANLIQSPIFETRTLQWTPVYTCSGSMTYGSVTDYMGTRSGYMVSGNKVIFQLFTAGTTGGTASNTINATMPISVGLTFQTAYGNVVEGTAYIAGRAYFNNTNILSMRRYDMGNFGIGTSRGAEWGGTYFIG